MESGARSPSIRRDGEPMRRGRSSCAPTPTSGRGRERVEGSISRRASTSRRELFEDRGCSPPPSRVSNLLGPSRALERGVQRSSSPSRRNGLRSHRTARPVTPRSSRGARSASPGARRGRERHREATPRTRRGSELRRLASPDTRRGRERHRQESDGPRVVRDGSRYPSTRRGRCSATLKSNRPSTNSPALDRGQRSSSVFPIQRGQVRPDTSASPTRPSLDIPHLASHSASPRERGDSSSDSRSLRHMLKRSRGCQGSRSSREEEVIVGVTDNAAEQGSLNHEEEEIKGRDNAAEQGKNDHHDGGQSEREIELPVVSIHESCRKFKRPRGQGSLINCEKEIADDEAQKGSIDKHEEEALKENGNAAEKGELDHQDGRKTEGQIVPKSHDIQSQGSLVNCEKEVADDASQQGSIRKHALEGKGNATEKGEQDHQVGRKTEGQIVPKNHNIQIDDQKQEPPIVSLHEDLFSQIFTRLDSTSACRLAAAGKCMVSRVRRHVQDNNVVPFLGVAMLNQGKFNRVISFRDRRLAREVKQSAKFVEKSLMMLPSNIEIIDFRFGFFTLKQCDNSGVSFYLLDPFIPRSWFVIPKFKASHGENVLTGTLVVPVVDSEHFSIVLLCLDSQKVGLDTLAIQVFKSETSEWRRTASSLRLRENEHIDKNAVHSGGYVHFLSKKTRRIIRIDPNQIAIDMIDLSDISISAQVIIAGISGYLSLVTQSNGVITILRYDENTWKMHKRLRSPQAVAWTSLVGSCEENSCLVAETATEQSHVIDIETGNWMELQPHCTGHRLLALEIKSPYKFPFPVPIWQPGNSMRLDSRLIMKRRRKVSKKDLSEGIRVAIQKLFKSNQDSSKSGK